MQDFKIISPEELGTNVFTSIGKNSMLITAGVPSHFNTMTASWGGFGVLWNKNVVFTFIRPQRYTFEFAEKHDTFSLCFFDDLYKSALTLCGTKSGRDIDKVSACGLSPVFEDDFVYFSEAKTVLLCKKLDSQFISPDGFADPSVMKNYVNGDYHKMYIGEIKKILTR